MSSSDPDTPEPFTGRYKLVSSENSDAFMRELGVGFVIRKLANVFTPTIEMGHDENGNYVAKAQTWAKTLEAHFQLGKEFEEIRFDGKKCLSTMVADGNKFIQIQKDGNQEVKYIREFEKNLMKVTATANGVSCFRVYERLPSQ